MNNFLLLIKKEIWENWVNNKIVMVFSILAIIAVVMPFTSYQSYLSRFTINSMPASELLVVFYAFLQVLLNMCIPFMVMGTVASEIKNNNAASVLVKPTGRAGYIISKYLVYMLIFGLATIVAIILSAVYANSLALDPNAFSDNRLWAMIGISLVFISFVVSLMVLLSTITKSQVIAGILGYCILVAGSAFGIVPAVLRFMPISLFMWMSEILNPKIYSPEYAVMVTPFDAWPAFFIALLAPIAFIFASIFIIKRKEL